MPQDFTHSLENRVPVKDRTSTHEVMHQEHPYTFYRSIYQLSPGPVCVKHTLVYCALGQGQNPTVYV